MGTELGTINIWLAILTLAVVVQTAMMIAAAVVALRVARRADAAMARSVTSSAAAPISPESTDF